VEAAALPPKERRTIQCGSHELTIITPALQLVGLLVFISTLGPTAHCTGPLPTVLRLNSLLGITRIGGTKENVNHLTEQRKTPRTNDNTDETDLLGSNDLCLNVVQ